MFLKNKFDEVKKRQNYTIIGSLLKKYFPNSYNIDIFNNLCRKMSKNVIKL